jgi:rubrerythrin
MYKFSRREFLFFSAISPLVIPFPAQALGNENNYLKTTYPNTLLVLEQAFKCEIIAYKHYLEYVEKAMAEKYPNIAYMFHAFSVSEKIHADNFERIIKNLGNEMHNINILIDVSDTKSNLISSAENELEKIETTYPEFLKKIKTEECEDAIINCMYSWKSHRQHEAKVKTIQKYSGVFFGSVAKKIEGVPLDFHVCEICGSTIDQEPVSHCDICNRSLSHYREIKRPI